MKKIAIFVSHPIQYQIPLFKRLAAELDIDLKVFFFWDFGVKETYDPQFDRKVKWDIPVLEGYKSEFLKNISPNKTSANFFGEINPGLVSKISGGRYDAIIVFGWQTISHWLAILMGFLTGTPVFIRGENPFNKEPKKSFLKRAVKQIILRGLFKPVKGFFCIGQENRKFYRYYGVPESKLHFVPYAVDNERFQRSSREYADKKQIRELKKKLGIDKEAVIILFSGKLIPLKRPSDLIRAYSKLSGKTALLFVGDGPLRPELEKFVRKNGIKNVYFLGFVNQSEIGKYYSAADIFVLLSDSETWGVVVNEVMNFGKPVVISDAVGCGSDLVKQGENGYIFPVGDIDKLSEYLNDLSQNSSRRKAFGKKSLEIVENYTFNKDIEVIGEVINNIK